MILLANSFFLRDDPKQLARMKPYPPLATLLARRPAARAGPRRGAVRRHVRARASTSSSRRWRRDGRAVVGILEDNFNFLTKMCTMRMREATLADDRRRARARAAASSVNGSDSTDNPAARTSPPAPTRCCCGEGDVDACSSWPTLWRPRATAPLDATSPGSCCRRRRRRSSARRARAGAPRPRRAAVARLGPGGRRALPPRLDAGARALLMEHGHVARLSLRLQLVREADVRPPLHPALARRRGATRCAQLKDEVAPDHIWFADDIFGLTPRWIERVRRRGRATSTRASPFMIQCRADLMTAARGGGAGARRRARRCGSAWSRARRRSSTRWTRARPSTQMREATRALQGARHPRLLVPAARLSRRDVGRHARDPRPRARGAARRHRRVGRLSAARHQVPRAASAAQLGRTAQLGATPTTWRCCSRARTPPRSTASCATRCTTRCARGVATSALGDASARGSGPHRSAEPFVARGA